jgi:hypothetical protein
MMLSSSRTFTGLAFALVLLLPSLARAQQPAVPPVGEPPPPEARAQEESVITSQAQQVYAASHQNELRQEAARQVEASRRWAWEERGRADTPPPVIVHPPALSLGLTGRFGLGLGLEKGTEVALGVATELDLRMKWWGLGLDAGILSLRTAESIRIPAAQTGAIITEASGYFVFLHKKMGRRISASHGVARFGHQLLMPMGQPTLPTAYLSFFAGLGGVIPVGPIVGGKGWVGFSYEFRLGYRFGLGVGIETPIEGGYIDLLTGPVVGF